MAGYEEQIVALHKRSNFFQQAAAEARECRERAEKKLANYEALDRLVRAYASRVVEKDVASVQLGLEEVATGRTETVTIRGSEVEKPVHRPVYRTVEEAVELIFADFEAAFQWMDDEAAAERDALLDEREAMLRVLGMDEHAWRRIAWRT